MLCPISRRINPEASHVPHPLLGENLTARISYSGKLNATTRFICVLRSTASTASHLIGTAHTSLLSTHAFGPLSTQQGFYGRNVSLFIAYCSLSVSNPCFLLNPAYVITKTRRFHPIQTILFTGRSTVAVLHVHRRHIRCAAKTCFIRGASLTAEISRSKHSSSFHT